MRETSGKEGGVKFLKDEIVHGLNLKSPGASLGEQKVPGRSSPSRVVRGVWSKEDQDLPERESPFQPTRHPRPYNKHGPLFPDLFYRGPGLRGVSRPVHRSLSLPLLP